MPPLLVGASAATAAEVAVGVLLYAGPGMMRSLTTILAVEAAALALGLWRGPSLSGPPVEALRRRWLLCLASFVLAAAFGTSWSVIEDLGGGPVGQGLGLAVLAAMPLYACGLVLGGMAAVDTESARERARPPGPYAALGAAAGFVLTGVLLPRAPIPSSLLVACLVMLSAAGLVYGVVLGARPTVRLRGARAVATGEARVEDRAPGRGEAGARYLLESGHVRGRVTLAGDSAGSWDVAVAFAALEGRAGSRVLSVGGGASPLARELMANHPDSVLHVLERGTAVVELGNELLGTGLDQAAGDGVRVVIDHLEDSIARADPPYELVLVDTGALAPLGGVGGLSQAAWGALGRAVAAGGALVIGPAMPASEVNLVAQGWRAVRLGGVGPEAGRGEDVLLVLTRPGEEPTWLTNVSGFPAREGEGVGS